MDDNLKVLLRRHNAALSWNSRKKAWRLSGIDQGFTWSEDVRAANRTEAEDAAVTYLLALDEEAQQLDDIKRLAGILPWKQGDEQIGRAHV